MASTVENYALEIEIFALSRVLRAQISRSCAQKRRFQRSVCGQSGRTNFFNRIGPKRSFRLFDIRLLKYSESRISDVGAHTRFDAKCSDVRRTTDELACLLDGAAARLCKREHQMCDSTWLYYGAWHPAVRIGKQWGVIEGKDAR